MLKWIKNIVYGIELLDAKWNRSFMRARLIRLVNGQLYIGYMRYPYISATSGKAPVLVTNRFCK
jgi:hypothetical protein